MKFQSQLVEKNHGSFIKFQRQLVMKNKKIFMKNLFNLKDNWLQKIIKFFLEKK